MKDPVTTAVLKAKHALEIAQLMACVQQCCRVQRKMLHGEGHVLVEVTADEVRVVLSRPVREMTDGEIEALVKEQLARDDELGRTKSERDSLKHSLDNERASNTNGKC